MSLPIALTVLAWIWVAPAPADCGQPPKIEASEDVRTHAVSLQAVRANLAAAYARACDERVLTEAGLGPKLILRNAPAANVALIYAADGDEGLVLEYPFVADGDPQVPPVEEIKEAIFCHVRGATAQEQEEEGRCLPD